MPTASNITDTARRFAAALDREDYEAAQALLAEDCHYETRAGAMIGAAAVMDSYRRSGEAARRLFDAVQYWSEPLNAGPDSVCVTFSDRISKAAKTHVFRSRQRLDFTSDGLIARITHEDLPEERKRLLQFCAACGVTLSDETDATAAGPGGGPRTRAGGSGVTEEPPSVK